MKCFLVLSLLLFGAGVAKADSPLTSTPFYTAYLSDKMVQYAEGEELDLKIIKFLTNTKVDMVLKIATINAMSWGNENNVILFEDYLLKKRKGLKPAVFEYLRTVSNTEPEENEQTLILTTADLTCWAYLNGMGHYNIPEKAIRGAYLAHIRTPKSMAHVLPFALLASQSAFGLDGCQIYMIPQQLLVETEYTHHLISGEAIDIIMDYINLYQEDCK